jgi:formylmethanofuran dehydrogenase subunit E
MKYIKVTCERCGDKFLVTSMEDYRDKDGEVLCEICFDEKWGRLDESE